MLPVRWLPSPRLSTLLCVRTVAGPECYSTKPQYGTQGSFELCDCVPAERRML